jgi:hypothetical protein
LQTSCPSRFRKKGTLLGTSPLHRNKSSLADFVLSLLRRFNKTKRGLELLRKPGILLLLQSDPSAEEEDEDEEHGSREGLEGLAELRDVVRVLKRAASKR